VRRRRNRWRAHAAFGFAERLGDYTSVQYVSTNARGLNWTSTRVLTAGEKRGKEKRKLANKRRTYHLGKRKVGLDGLPHLRKVRRPLAIDAGVRNQGAGGERAGGKREKKEARDRALYRTLSQLATGKGRETD